MYTTALLCLIILASPIVQSQYQLVSVNIPPGLAESTSGTNTYPSIRQNGCLQIKNDNTGLYLFGGMTNDTTVAANTLWFYNFATAKWSIVINPSNNSSTTPAGREYMACWVGSGVNGTFNIAGGDNGLGTIYGDHWYATVATSSPYWTFTGGANAGRVTQGANWRINDITYWFGGYNPTITTRIRQVVGVQSWSTKLNFYAYDGVRAPVYTGTQNPGSRARMAFAANSTGGWMFGGVSAQSVYGDLWFYNPAPAVNGWTFVSGKTTVNDSSTSDNQPPCMSSSVMAITTYGNVLLYGGQGVGAMRYTTLWKYSISGNIWTRFSGSVFPSTVAPLTSLISYAPDFAGGVYMFGGVDTSGAVTNKLYHLKFSECPLGSFINTSNMCSPCPFGNTGATNNSDVCGTCQPGTYVKTNNSCAPCPIGTYTNTPGKSSCSPCGVGLAALTNASIICQSCNVGSYALNGICVLCPPGSYSNSATNLACLACPPGTFNAGSGATSCQNCPAGQYSAGNATSCTDCAPGTVRFAATSGPCAPCDPGSSTIQSDSTKAGFGNTSTTVCTKCPQGTFADAYGSAGCSPCGYGTAASPAGQVECRLCQPGAQGKTLVGNTCGSCPYTGFTSTYANRFCVFCPYGSVPNNINQTGCAYCPAGTFHDGLNTDGCGRDKNGNFIPCCSPCPVGTFAEKQGTKTCTPCAPGFFANTTGNAYCLQCPLNTRSQPGNAGCLNCPSGTYSPGGSQWCSPSGY